MDSFLAAVGTIIGIAALTFYRDWRDGKPLFRRGNDDMGDREMLSLMRGLKAHYNDDTTRILTDICLKLDKIDDLRDSIRVGFAAMSQKFNEWDRYGIKTDSRRR